MGGLKNRLDCLSTDHWVMLDTTRIVIAIAFTDAIQVSVVNLN
jgi:hypothetical protein